MPTGDFFCPEGDKKEGPELINHVKIQEQKNLYSSAVLKTFI